jgi:hypothetical protein
MGDRNFVREVFCKGGERAKIGGANFRSGKNQR